MSKLDELNRLVDSLPRGYRDLDMGVLRRPVLEAMPELLEQPCFSTLYVKYEPPYLMRTTWRVGEQQEARVNSHFFFGANFTDKIDPVSGLTNPYFGNEGKKGKNLYHPHDWAAIFEILEGHYDQRVGYAAEPGLSVAPEQTHLFMQNAASPEFNFHVLGNPLTWHEVVPQGAGPVSTIMTTFIPDDWGQCGPQPGEKQPSLNREEEAFMRDHFKPLVAARLEQLSRPLPTAPAPTSGNL